MDLKQSNAKLYKQGLMANDIHLVLKKWIIEEQNLGLILSDKNTVFASMRNVVGTKDTLQCRKLLGLAHNVDLAFIFTVTMANTRFADKDVVTTWIGSDLQDSSIRIVIRGELSPELKNVGVGTVCAILNPTIKEQMISSDLKSITISQPDDILIIGQLDGLHACKGITTKGDMCKNLVYVHNQGEYCKYHVKFAHKRKRSPKPKKVGTDTGKKASNTVMIELEGRPYTFVEPEKPARPIDTINKLGELNSLMQKIINKRTVSNVSTTSTVVSNSEVARPRQNRESTKEFEKLAELIKQYQSTNSKEYNKMLGTLQLMARKLKGVTSDVVERTQINKICSLLMDHPVENIAISALKLRRAIRRTVKAPNKDKVGEYRITGPNTALVKRETGTTDQPRSREEVRKELDEIIGMSSSVDAIVERERGAELVEKLSTIEKLDNAEQFKQTIEYIEVMAYHCEECDIWSETVNRLCSQEKHRLNQKAVRKEWHTCINKLCQCKYYSLNGQKPARCPKCRESTVVSEKTSFYKPRPDYPLPNETLKTEAGLDL